MEIQMSPEQCRAARAWLGWTQAELAQRANVGLSALKDFEKGARRTLAAIRLQIQRAFEESGVEFPSDDSIRVKTVIENQS
jgi:transcriptional regulator with XRE-family HTH domain